MKKRRRKWNKHLLHIHLLPKNLASVLKPSNFTAVKMGFMYPYAQMLAPYAKLIPWPS
jgi:hypothetical protein